MKIDCFCAFVGVILFTIPQHNFDPGFNPREALRCSSNGRHRHKQEIGNCEVEK